MAFTVDSGGGIVTITVEGHWGLSEALEAQELSARSVREGGLVGVLVDLRRASIRASTADIYEVTSGHALAFPPGTRHAVVAVGVMPPEDVRFSEDVAANRCVALRIFDDPGAARAWLLEKRP